MGCHECGVLTCYCDQVVANLTYLSFQQGQGHACWLSIISSELGTAFLAHNRGCKTIFEQMNRTLSLRRLWGPRRRNPLRSWESGSESGQGREGKCWLEREPTWEDRQQKGVRMDLWWGHGGLPLCKELGLPLGHVAHALGMKRSGNLSYRWHFGCLQSFKIHPDLCLWLSYLFHFVYSFPLSPLTLLQVIFSLHVFSCFLLDCQSIFFPLASSLRGPDMLLPY